MKRSELTFAEGFTDGRGQRNRAKGVAIMAFDWRKAAEIIKSKLKEHPNLIAQAGLQGDWNYTGGIIFEDGRPTNEGYTYLASNWATPTLILAWDGEDQQEIDCYCEEGKYTSDSKWDDESLALLGLTLKEL